MALGNSDTIRGEVIVILNSLAEPLRGQAIYISSWLRTPETEETHPWSGHLSPDP